MRVGCEGGLRGVLASGKCCEGGWAEHLRWCLRRRGAVLGLPLGSYTRVQMWAVVAAGVVVAVHGMMVERRRKRQR